MLDKIKILLGLTNDSKDELLSILIALCKDEAVDFCNLTEYNNKLDSAIIMMVIERYNRMGSEGAKSQSASGISASYDSFYSDKVVKMLNKHRKVRCV